MRLDVSRDLSDSAHDFLRVVWPAISPWCRGGELKPVEAIAPAQFERQLDTLAGIDAWQIIDDAGIRGICSRVQWMPKKADGTYDFYKTFTVRKRRTNGVSTEWEKRTLALANKEAGFIRPALIVHAYVQMPRRMGELIYVCMCRADDLFSLAKDEMEGAAWYPQRNGQDGNEFAVFRVDWLRRLDVKVRDSTMENSAG